LTDSAPGSRGDRLPLPVWAIPAVLLLLALGPWPYGYYVLLRLVVCLASIFIAWRLKKKGEALMWAFVTLAILYNPIVKVPLGREVWMVANLISLVPFAYVGLRRTGFT
jgi:hypothetical protein